MQSYDWYTKNIIAILGLIFTVSTAVVLFEQDTMSNLRICNVDDSLCIILANIGFIATLGSILTFACFLIAVFIDFIFLIPKKIYFGLKKYIKTPIFNNIKVKFIETPKDEILIQVFNREWRSDSITVEAISNGRNLRWIPYQESDIRTIQRWEKATSILLKPIGNKFQIDHAKNKEDSVDKFSIGKHKIEVNVYITIQRTRICRTFFVEVEIRKGKKPYVSDLIQLQDIPQEFNRFELFEI